MKKLTNGIYWTVDYEWIKKEILKTYTVNDVTRKLIISKSFSDYNGKLGYVFFAVRGSPPKGCAIYSPGHKKLTIIDAWSEKKKTYNNIFIKEIDNEEIVKVSE